MSKKETIKIFLASPSDVKTERRYVKQTIDEINRTIAPDKGVILDVVSSERSFPGYGKDGQAILNDQIGNMQEYELFIGIMWNRIGTPTPRAISGTVEEFDRADKAFRRKAKPQIWFYFRQLSGNPITQEDKNQQAEVKKFREKFLGKGKVPSKGKLHDYKTPAEFRRQFREHLALWLNHRNRDGSTSRNSFISNQKETSRTEATKKSGNTGQGIRTVTSPRNWVMLNEKFFNANSIITQPDQSIVLQISPTNMEQVAELKSFNPGTFHNSKRVEYADHHNSALMQISSVSSESSIGKTIFTITLSPIQRSHNISFGRYNNYDADEIAELYARLILLNESLPKDLMHFSPSIQVSGLYNHTKVVEKGIFPELWAKLETRSNLFLPKAWLMAKYYLQMGQVVDDILELKLGPIKNKVMSVQFRGRKKGIYDQEFSIIKVVGDCPLSA